MTKDSFYNDTNIKNLDDLNNLCEECKKNDESVSQIAETIPMRRLGNPEDIANACLFVASEASNWMTGTNIVVHGGGEKPSYLSATTAFEGS